MLASSELSELSDSFLILSLLSNDPTLLMKRSGAPIAMMSNSIRSSSPDRLERFSAFVAWTTTPTVNTDPTFASSGDV